MLRALFFLLAVAVASTAPAQTYQIQPGDTLEISVLEDSSLGRTVLVRPDGRISLPLAGSIDVAGRSPEQVEAAIRQRLSRDFVSPPTVTVALAALAPPGAAAPGETAPIYMIGAVASPGRYDVELPIDVLQALALAGGPGVFAASHRIQVRRRSPEGETVLLFDFDAVADGLVPTRPIALRSGDVVVVPERGLFE